MKFDNEVTHNTVMIMMIMQYITVQPCQMTFLYTHPLYTAKP